MKASQPPIPFDQPCLVALNFLSAGSFALLPVGYAVAGWATAALGAPLVCVLGGGITMVFSALGLLHPAIRRLD